MSDAPQWKFRQMHAGELNIDPIEAEFFSTEALGSLADALVREAIQNSLDARLPGTPLRIRIVFPPPQSMLRDEYSARYLKGLFAHLDQSASGLTKLPSHDEPLEFIVLEDFGTRGLQGDPNLLVLGSDQGSPLVFSRKRRNSWPKGILERHFQRGNPGSKKAFDQLGLSLLSLEQRFRRQIWCSKSENHTMFDRRSRAYRYVAWSDPAHISCRIKVGKGFTPYKAGIVAFPCRQAALCATAHGPGRVFGVIT